MPPFVAINKQQRVSERHQSTFIAVAACNHDDRASRSTTTYRDMIRSLKNKVSRGTSDGSSGETGGTAAGKPPPPPLLLPILIVPGFLSSGLVVEKSELKKTWEGKRLWLNLLSLGFHAVNFGGRDRVIGGQKSSGGGGTVDDEDPVIGGEENNDDDDETEQLRYNLYKSLWIQHMALCDDMQTEHPGIRVRNIAGLPGVDYLTPARNIDQRHIFCFRSCHQGPHKGRVRERQEP